MKKGSYTMVKNIRYNAGFKQYIFLFFTLMVCKVGAEEMEISQLEHEQLKLMIENYEDHEEKFTYFMENKCEISNVDISRKKWLHKKIFQVLFYGDVPRTSCREVFFLDLKNNGSESNPLYDVKLFYLGFTDPEFFSVSTSYSSSPVPEKKLDVRMGIRGLHSGVVDSQHWEIRLA